jgi:hypothetical protein
LYAIRIAEGDAEMPQKGDAGWSKELEQLVADMTNGRVKYKTPGKPVPAPAELVDGAEIVAAAEVDTVARALATRIGYQLPADSTSPDLICRDIAANARRSVEACLEMGRGLLVLKQVCGHGNFIARIEQIGVDIRRMFTPVSIRWRGNGR